MFSASPEWTDRDCSIPRYRERERGREREREELHTHILTLKCTGREEEVGADSLQQPQRMSRPTSLSGSRQGSKMDGTGKAVKRENAGRLTAIRNVFLSP